MKLRVIVNPKAGAGAAKRRIPEISRALEQEGLDHEVRETAGPGDARRLVDQARTDGIECVALVGGDGTLNEACQAYLDHSGNVVPGPDLALVPAGTGGDFRKTFGLGEGIRDAVHRIARATPRPLDLGVLEVVSNDGDKVVRAFLNIASFGIGGLTDRIVNATPKWMGGRVAFYLGTLRAMLAYRNAPVVVRLDGQELCRGPILNVAIANGRFFGGGMKIAPDADPSDGLFDVVVLGDLDRIEAVGLSRRIYRGSHIGDGKVRVGRGSVVEAEPLHPAERVLVDMDGETPGRIPLRARCAAGALRIRV